MLIKILKPFRYAHDGIRVQSFERAGAVEETTSEAAEHAVAFGLAELAEPGTAMASEVEVAEQVAEQSAAPVPIVVVAPFRFAHQGIRVEAFEPGYVETTGECADVAIAAGWATPHVQTSAPIVAPTDEPPPAESEPPPAESKTPPAEIETPAPESETPAPESETPAPESETPAGSDEPDAGKQVADQAALPLEQLADPALENRDATSAKPTRSKRST